jgi:hypothetical protein
MEHVPPSRLAELPPIKWEETKRRMKAVSTFLDGEDRSSAAIRRLAGELGTSRPMIYKLLKTRERWKRDDAVALRAPRRPWDEAANAIVLEALAACGPGATLQEVNRSAERIARHRDARPPVRSLVRRLYGRRTAGSAIAQRLSLSTEMALDSAALAVRVMIEDGRSVLPKLTAVVDLGSGGLVDWQLSPGAADLKDVVGLVERVPEARRGGSLALTSAFSRETRAELQSQTGLPIFEGRPIRRGSVIVAALGSRIGRIPILPCTESSSSLADLPSVRFDDLDAVLRVLLPIEDKAASDGPMQAGLS